MTAELIALLDGKEVGRVQLDDDAQHSRRRTQTRGPSKWISVVTLDEALARFPQAADGRIVLKIDAEGSSRRFLRALPPRSAAAAWP